MDKKNIILNYRKLMKKYYPQLFDLSRQVNQEKFKEYKRMRFPRAKVTSLSINSYKMLTQPLNEWTDSQIKEASKVIDYLRHGKVGMIKNKTTYVYKRPLYWGASHV